MTRHERVGIEFPEATWTSFDRYDRYGAIARCLRASLGSTRLRVLDVGDAAGYLRYFAGELDLVGIDISVQPDRLGGAVAMAASGLHLPFADGTFDAVVSSDVLEHVPPEDRAAFLREIGRVSRDLLIVAAPFDTEGVAGAEELVRRFAPLVTGEIQEQLEEHSDNGLPDLDETAVALQAHGPVAVCGNGNLWDWLELMLVKHQLLARPALQPFHDGIDLLYNFALAGRASAPPHYRHLVAARRQGQVELGAITGSSVPDPVMAGIVTSLLGAAGPESTRQDTVPSLDRMAATLASVEARLTELGERVTALSADVENVRYLSAETTRVLGRILSPLRRLRRLAPDRWAE